MKKIILVIAMFVMPFGVLAATKIPTEDTVSIETLRKMLGDKTKVTSYQKYLLIEDLKRKQITGEGKVIDIKRDMSGISGVRVIMSLQLEDVQKNFVMVLRKDMVRRAATLSVGERVKFKGRIEQPSALDDTPMLIDGSFEIIMEKSP